MTPSDLGRCFQSAAVLSSALTMVEIRAHSPTNKSIMQTRPPRQCHSLFLGPSGAHRSQAAGLGWAGLGGGFGWADLFGVYLSSSRGNQVDCYQTTFTSSSSSSSFLLRLRLLLLPAGRAHSTCCEAQSEARTFCLQECSAADLKVTAECPTGSLGSHC